MSRSVESSFETRGTAKCLGLDTAQIVNFVNTLKNFTVYLSIFILIFSLQVILAKKIGRKILQSLNQIYRHSLNIISFVFCS